MPVKSWSQRKDNQEVTDDTWSDIDREEILVSWLQYVVRGFFCSVMIIMDISVLFRVKLVLLVNMAEAK